MTEYAIDYAWGRPNIAALRAAGIRVVCRYLSHDRSGKTLTADEYRTLDAAGIYVVPNFEDSATRALQGYNAGVADASFANALATQIGIPTDRAIVYSVDTDPTPPAVIDYFRGLHAAGGARPVDAYGGAWLLKTLRAAGLIPPAPSGWNANATSWDHGPVDPDAILHQLTSHPVTIAGFPPNQYDVSIIQHPVSDTLEDMTPEQADQLAQTRVVAQAALDTATRVETETKAIKAQVDKLVGASIDSTGHGLLGRIVRKLGA